MTEKTNSITAYKGFDKNFKCRDIQFEIGKTYKHKGEVSVCNSGFHACENPLAAFKYYQPTSRFARVKCAGKISKDINDKKIACEELTVEAEIGLPELIDDAVQWIHSRVDLENKKISNTGDWSVASNASYKSAASNTGKYSAASNTGNQSVASNAGDYSAAEVSGLHSVVCNAGEWSAASSTGEQSAASSTGYQSEAEVSGLHSVACALGTQSKVKASEGGAIVCVYRNDDGDLVHIRASKVGENGIKADTWYVLGETGEFAEYD